MPIGGPNSTPIDNFAILYLPTEGLYAEVIRRPGLLDDLQRKCRIVVAGPTVLLALLNSLRLGFRTLAIQKRSSEVWQLLAAVKTEFGKYGGVLFIEKEIDFGHFKAGQLDLEVHVDESLQLNRQDLSVPTRFLRQLVVGQDVSTLLFIAEMLDPQRRNLGETQ